MRVSTCIAYLNNYLCIHKCLKVNNMKKLTTILLVLATLIPIAGAQSTDIFKKKKKKKE